MEQTILLLLVALQIKHLWIDWCWQPAFEWKNKGVYGHMGGIVHASKNAVGTGLCFMFFFSPGVAITVLAIDFVIHYHVDWAKMNINRIMKWEATKNEQFWWLTGIDQAIHQLTYLLLVYCAITW